LLEYSAFLSLNLAILPLLAGFVNSKIIANVILGAELPWSRNGNARWGFIEEVSIFAAEYVVIFNRTLRGSDTLWRIIFRAASLMIVHRALWKCDLNHSSFKLREFDYLFIN
jgi:hypothetical protein